MPPKSEEKGEEKDPTESDPADSKAEAKADADQERDPQVWNSLSLGWEMALYYSADHARVVRERKAPPDRLPGRGSLGLAERDELELVRIQARIARLEPRLSAAGLHGPSVEAVRAAQQASRTREQWRTPLFELHIELLQTLVAADFRLGLAYQFGRALCDTSLALALTGEEDRRELADVFSRHRVAQLDRWLRDLDTALPPHAAKAVSGSLGRWSDWAAENQIPSKDDLTLLGRQGERWRSVLCGETASTDLLKPRHYFDASSEALTSLRRVSSEAISRFPLLFFVLALVLVLGVVVLVRNESTGASLAALVAVAGSLGISWKAIGSTLSGLAGLLKEPLWSAALDAVTASAITELPAQRTRAEHQSDPELTGTLSDD